MIVIAALPIPCAVSREIYNRFCFYRQLANSRKSDSLFIGLM